MRKVFGKPVAWFQAVFGCGLCTKICCNKQLENPDFWGGLRFGCFIVLFLGFVMFPDLINSGYRKFPFSYLGPYVLIVRFFFLFLFISSMVSLLPCAIPFCFRSFNEQNWVISLMILGSLYWKVGIIFSLKYHVIVSFSLVVQEGMTKLKGIGTLQQKFAENSGQSAFFSLLFTYIPDSAIFGFGWCLGEWDLMVVLIRKWLFVDNVLRLEMGRCMLQMEENLKWEKILRMLHEHAWNKFWTLHLNPSNFPLAHYGPSNLNT